MRHHVVTKKTFHLIVSGDRDTIEASIQEDLIDEATVIKAIPGDDPFLLFAMVAQIVFEQSKEPVLNVRHQLYQQVSSALPF